MKRLFLAFVLLVLVIYGCKYQAKEAQMAEGGMMQAAPTPQPTTTAATMTGSTGLERAAAKPVTQQKIIRTAAIEIDSKDLENDLAQIEKKVTELGGYVASSTNDRRSEARRTAYMSVRIPADKLDEFLKFLDSSFSVEQLSTNSQDITEEYVDISARLGNAKRHEQRLLELLETNTGKLEDILNVEREIARIREEIEILEGKIRYFDNRVNLSTVEISLYQEKSVSQIKSPWLKRVWMDVKDTVGDSIALLGRSIRGLVLFVAATIPWAIAGIVVLYLPLKFILRRRRAKKG